MVHRDVNFFNLYDKTVRGDPLVLLTACTGTAAFNIGGITLHSVLCLPTTRTECLSEEKQTTLQSQLHQLQLLVIDGVSMIPDKMLDLSHKRHCTAKQVISQQLHLSTHVSWWLATSASYFLLVVPHFLLNTILVT